jgi:hypothetical protein
MKTITSLFCACGRNFYAPGVEPGHLAKCPECGAYIRVPLGEPQEGDIAARPSDAAPRRRRRASGASLRDCLLYPLRDGPGIALLVAMPPFVWIMSVPVLDIVRFAVPARPGENFNPVYLLIVPAAIPLAFSFIMTIGYILLFLGGVLVSSALGEENHPNWPWWDFSAIAEGIARWVWATLVGVATGAFPVIIYWLNCGDIDIVDRIIFVELSALMAGYALMALAASLLHNSVLAANPWMVLQAIRRLGWAYLRPSLVAGVAVVLVASALYAVLFRAPNVQVAALGLWAWWVFALYAAMVVLRMVGLTYHEHADELGWYRSKPKWAVWGRQGTIYANS